MRLSELLGLEVLSESGESLGQVHDVRGELGSRSLRVTGLVVGGPGVLERLGLRVAGNPARRSKNVVPWTSVVRADRRGIVVKDQAAQGDT
jgi:sporulation protein YlmC with PRC-barrel domain